VAGAGAAFPRAPYQVLGHTRYDQTWIDKTIEAEVAGFHFARPARRPTSLNPMPVKAPASFDRAAIAAPAAAPLPQFTVPKKKHWWQKLRRPSKKITE
jgi:hypothetical protein